MYGTLLVLLLAASAALTSSGLRAASRVRIGVGLALGIATVIFFASLSFWGEMLWFEALGYEPRFWTLTGAKAGLTLGSALLTALLLWPLVSRVEPPSVKRTALLLAALAGGHWGYSSWNELLVFLYRVPTGIREPILGFDAGFYLFTLPLLDGLWNLALILALLALGAVLAQILVEAAEGVEGKVLVIDSERGEVALHPATRKLRGSGLGPKAWTLLARPLALLALVLALDRLKAVPHLLYSKVGAVSGPGWTDVHIRLPALLLVALALVGVAAAMALPRLRSALSRRAARRGVSPGAQGPAGLLLPWALAGGLALVGLVLLPALVQSIWVEPSEISFEAPYIAHNIELTRKAFGLDRVEEREFSPDGPFDPEVARRNQDLLVETRLWDWNALDSVYQQFQEMRLYYEFHDLDVDRYEIDGRLRQVMVSAREMESSNLPEQSQTFVNRHFKYTHGYGLTLAPVSEFTPQGLPNLLIRDLPPTTEVPELTVERPQIYYGELTDEHVYVNTREEEFDYPSGDENVYIRYPGQGGVQLSNLWRRFVFGWMFDGHRLFLSEYPTAESRILFHRQIQRRVERVAPFLTLDRDPYLVLAEGKLYWILDAYTTSAYFPYGEPYSGRELLSSEAGQAVTTSTLGRYRGVNYMRNSVKAVVDAFEGTVDLYVFEPEDPLIQVWQRIFPGLLQGREAFPEALASHVRYPDDLFLIQGLVYAKYHMRDPEVFYNQEDLWVRATESYYSQVRPVAPYSVMWKPPESEKTGPEFTTILPFTPKNRQVLVGWMAALSDPPNYGRLLAYQFSKQERVLGPQQVETKIDQDPFLSQQLTLWDQRGSRVIRGNVLAIPIEDTLLYVEPIYLQAETAAYPELRLVVVMHGDDLAYGESFSAALMKLLGTDVLAGTALAMDAGEEGAEASTPEASEDRASPASPLAGQGFAQEAEGAAAPSPLADEAVDGDLASLARQAEAAFDRYLELQAERRFAEAAEELERLGRILEEMGGRR